MTADEIFISRSRYWLTKEYPIKLRHCVNALPPDAVWTRPNESSNSIGNLLVHLTGNVTEWILGGVGGQTISRYRAGEFAQKAGRDGNALLDDLETVLNKADSVLARLKPENLERPIVIQGRETTVIGAIYHVVEHFGMHTGQIIYIAKLRSGTDLGFYRMIEGIPTAAWPGRPEGGSA